MKFCIKLEHSFLHGNYSDDSEGHSHGQLVIGGFIMTPAPESCLMQFFCETSNHPGDSAPLQPSFGAL